MFENSLIIKIVIVLIVCLCAVETKECYSCEGINCLRTSKIKDTISCPDAMDSCITVFQTSAIIARGCYSKLPEVYRSKCDSLSNVDCYTCYTDLCNDRGSISCLQCNSNVNENCNNDISKIAPSRCSASTGANSYCYTRKTSDHIERGCLIDTNDQLKCLADSSCDMCLPDNDEACNRESNVTKTSESGAKHLTIYTASMLLALLAVTSF